MSAPDDLDSEWWYWVAVTPLFGGLIALALSGLTVTLTIRPESNLSLLLPALVALTLLSLVFGVAFPLALYRDAEAIDAAGVAWAPDGRRYAALGALSVVASAFLGTIPLGVYYLAKRHRHVGTP